MVQRWMKFIDLSAYLKKQIVRFLYYIAAHLKKLYLILPLNRFLFFFFKEMSKCFPFSMHWRKHVFSAEFNFRWIVASAS